MPLNNSIHANNNGIETRNATAKRDGGVRRETETFFHTTLICQLLAGLMACIEEIVQSAIKRIFSCNATQASQRVGDERWYSLILE